MEIRFTEEQIKKALKVYYKDFENENCDIKVSKEIRSIGFYETKQCVVTVTKESTIIILNQKIKMKNDLEQEEIKKAFEEILKKEGLEVTKLEFDAFIDEDCIGYGMCEEYIEKPKFKGIVIQANKLEKNKVNELRK